MPRCHQSASCGLTHISAVWHVIADGLGADLAQRIEQFVLTPSSLNFALLHSHRNQLDLAFQTILNNRPRHGGILANGAGFIKAGEVGKGLTSCWYPQILALIFAKTLKAIF